jgi:hypothetical protein
MMRARPAVFSSARSILRYTFRPEQPSDDGRSFRGEREPLRGVPWARIGEFVGQRNLSVTADVYSHVLGDETELDYESLLR